MLIGLCTVCGNTQKYLALPRKNAEGDYQCGRCSGKMNITDSAAQPAPPQPVPEPEPEVVEDQVEESVVVDENTEGKEEED